MSQKCPVCQTKCKEDATSCSFCKFTYEGGINFQSVNQKDLDDWRNAVFVYRDKWEAEKKADELQAQLDAAKKREAELTKKLEAAKNTTQTTIPVSQSQHSNSTTVKAFMSQKCPVCETKCKENATTCSVCKFTDELGINRTWITEEDYSNWHETVIKPYKIKWEAEKKAEAAALRQAQIAADEARRRAENITQSNNKSEILKVIITIFFTIIGAVSSVILGIENGSVAGGIIMGICVGITFACAVGFSSNFFKIGACISGLIGGIIGGVIGETIISAIYGIFIGFIIFGLTFAGVKGCIAGVKGCIKDNKEYLIGLIISMVIGGIISNLIIGIKLVEAISIAGIITGIGAGIGGGIGEGKKKGIRLGILKGILRGIVTGPIIFVGFLGKHFGFFGMSIGILLAACVCAFIWGINHSHE